MRSPAVFLGTDVHVVDRGSKNLSWGGHKTREDLSHHLHCKEKEAYDVAQRMAMTTRGIGESKAYQESVMTLHAGVVAGIEEISPSQKQYCGIC